MKSIPIARPALAPPVIPPEDPLLGAAVLLDLEELADSVDTMNDEVGVVATSGEDEVAAAMVGVGVDSKVVPVAVSLTAATVLSAVGVACTVARSGVSDFCVC